MGCSSHGFLPSELGCIPQLPAGRIKETEGSSGLWSREQGGQKQDSPSFRLQKRLGEHCRHSTVVPVAGHLLLSGRVHRILRTGSRLSIWGTCFIYTMASTPLTKPGRRYHSDFTKDKMGQGVSSVSPAAGRPELSDSDYSGSRIFRLVYPSPLPCSTALSPRPGLSVNKSQLLHQT